MFAMVIAYHCIFGAYGFWLPNDPRGSGSDYIASWELYRFGPATKTRGRKSRAHQSHDRAARMQARQALRHPPVELTGLQAKTVAEGFAWAAEEADYRLHACAIMPAHVHLVIGRHPRDIRRVVGHLKARATRLLRLRGPWHEDDRPVWGEHGWNVFLNDARAVQAAIEYVEDNPVKEGKRQQRWSFVVPFNPTAALATARQARVASDAAK